MPNIQSKLNRVIEAGKRNDMDGVRDELQELLRQIPAEIRGTVDPSRRESLRADYEMVYNLSQMVGLEDTKLSLDI